MAQHTPLLPSAAARPRHWQFPNAPAFLQAASANECRPAAAVRQGRSEASPGVKALRAQRLSFGTESTAASESDNLTDVAGAVVLSAELSISILGLSAALCAPRADELRARLLDVQTVLEQVYNDPEEVGFTLERAPRGKTVCGLTAPQWHLIDICFKLFDVSRRTGSRAQPKLGPIVAKHFYTGAAAIEALAEAEVGPTLAKHFLEMVGVPLEGDPVAQLHKIQGYRGNAISKLSGGDSNLRTLQVVINDVCQRGRLQIDAESKLQSQAEQFEQALLYMHRHFEQKFSQTAEELAGSIRSIKELRDELGSVAAESGRMRREVFRVSTESGRMLAALRRIMPYRIANISRADISGITFVQAINGGKLESGVVRLADSDVEVVLKTLSLADGAEHDRVRRTAQLLRDPRMQGSGVIATLLSIIFDRYAFTITLVYKRSMPHELGILSGSTGGVAAIPDRKKLYAREKVGLSCFELGSFPRLLAAGKLIAQMAWAMWILHVEMGFRHGDLDPAQILVDFMKADDDEEYMAVVLTDFDDATPVGDAVEWLGKPQTFPPEVATELDSSGYGDMFRLGAAMFEMAYALYPGALKVTDSGVISLRDGRPMLSAMGGRCCPGLASFLDNAFPKLAAELFQVPGASYAQGCGSFPRLLRAFLSMLDLLLQPEPTHRPTADALIRCEFFWRLSYIVADGEVDPEPAWPELQLGRPGGGVAQREVQDYSVAPIFVELNRLKVQMQGEVLHVVQRDVASTLSSPGDDGIDPRYLVKCACLQMGSNMLRGMKL